MGLEPVFDLFFDGQNFFGGADIFIIPQLMEEEVVEMVEKMLITVAFGKICAQGP